MTVKTIGFREMVTCQQMVQGHKDKMHHVDVIVINLRAIGRIMGDEMTNKTGTRLRQTMEIIDKEYIAVVRGNASPPSKMPTQASWGDK